LRIALLPAFGGFSARFLSPDIISASMGRAKAHST